MRVLLLLLVTISLFSLSTTYAQSVSEYQVEIQKKMVRHSL